jgi:LPS-assembly protein
MTRPRTISMLVLLLFAATLIGGEPPQPQQPEGLIIESLRGEEGAAVYDLRTGVAYATNGVKMTYGNAVLTAERAAWSESTYEVEADGDVRIQQGDQLWVSEHVSYNFKTKRMEARQFRTGQVPIFAGGIDLQGDMSNRVYVARNALITADDVAKPVFYFPYYTRSLDEHAGHLSATPGYRSLFGPFILGSYTWWYNEQLDGIAHLDYRSKRGPGVGPDFNYHLGPWGNGTFRYYYTHDNDPTASGLGVPIGEDRQRVWFSYDANPATNLYLKSMVRYESDLAVVRDFFEPEYRRDPQPNTFFEAHKFWQNFSLDAYMQPRLNEFLQTVERLPDIRVTGYRQQLGESPFYYESETSAGYYRLRFAENAGLYGPPPGLNYEAGRADTFHQITLPQTFFGWLNVTPRVGGRGTFYSEASGPGATTTEEYRGVFNTGAEVSFKASRLWPEVQSKALDLDGLRHIVVPSGNYVYVPSPSEPPQQLPQFDSELPSLRLLPIEYPDYNAIDSIDSQNVIRWGLLNKLQTKRQGRVVNFLTSDFYVDWRLKPRSDQTTFSDLYHDFTLRPMRWLTLESLVRYEIDTGEFRMAYNTLSIAPNDVWSWRLGYYYLRDEPTNSVLSLGPGNDVFTSTLTYRLNENWAFRASHYFDAKVGRLLEQSYTVYRDMRSWTAALSFLVRYQQPGRPEDYTVAFTFSLKAFPRLQVGQDQGLGLSLFGG